MTVVLDVHGEAARDVILQAMRAALGLGRDQHEDSRRCCGLFGSGVEGVAAGACKGVTAKHYHRPAVGMVNLGSNKHWQVSAVSHPTRCYSVVLLPPTPRDRKTLRVQVLYLPPRYHHTVTSDPNSLAVHACVMPPSQRMTCTVWAMERGLSEQSGKCNRPLLKFEDHNAAVQAWVRG